MVLTPLPLLPISSFPFLRGKKKKNPRVLAEPHPPGAESDPRVQATHSSSISNPACVTPPQYSNTPGQRCRVTVSSVQYSVSPAPSESCLPEEQVHIMQMRERQNLNPSKPPQSYLVRPVRRKGTNRLREGKEEKRGDKSVPNSSDKEHKEDENRGG